jgi:hypothetical protein
MRQAKQPDSYKDDFYKWTKTQASFLKKGEFSKLDLDHIIEEIEDLAKSERKALKNQMIRLLMHLLKINYQPQKHTKSWDKSIANARLEIEIIIEESPSLKRELPAIFEEAYLYARKKAHIETGLDIKTFPINCPWTLKEIMK